MGDNIYMNIKRLMTVLAYGGTPVRPANVSAGRWGAMIKRALTDLRG